MKNNLIHKCALFIFAFLVTFSAYAAAPGESIVKDVGTGNYTVTYCGTGPDETVENCNLRQVTFVPANRIDPRVRSSLKLDRQWNVQFRYSVANNRSSAQPLISFGLDPLTEIKSPIPLSKKWVVQTDAQMEAEVIAGRKALVTPRGWQGEVLPSDKGGLRVIWLYKNTENVRAGLPPGRMEQGFAFSSPDLPGIGLAEFSGNSGPGMGFVDAGPDGDIAQQLRRLEADNSFVYRYTALPAIPVLNPFNAGTVLLGIHRQTQTWVSMQLLDPALSSQLDRRFQAAIDAANRNDEKAVIAQLAEVRKLIKSEHLDIDNDESEETDATPQKRRVLISKLAAKILNFNLKYVKKRLGGGDD